MRKTVIMVTMALFASTPTWANDKLPDGGVSVDLTFVSNYVFRGSDFFVGAAQQAGKAYGSNTGAVAFQPSITFSTPVEGLTFNIWGSFAMSGRKDKDIDQVFQSGAGTADLLASTSGADPAAVLATAAATSAASATSASGLVGIENTFPGLYKEANGLERLDEVDYTIGYSTSTKKGDIGFGIIHYTGVNPKGINGLGITEVYGTYALPFLTDLTFGINARADTGNEYQYYSVSYGRDIIEDTLSFGITAGYQVQNNLQGFNNVTANLSYSISGFTIGLNLVYRPDLKMVVENGGTRTNLPVELLGGARLEDGMAQDYSQTNGPLNAAINSQVGAAIQTALQTATGNSALTYSYTPRAKLPKMLYYVSAGYTIEM